MNRDGDIADARKGYAMSMEEIAAELHINKRQVEFIIRSAMKKIRQRVRTKAKVAELLRSIDRERSRRNGLNTVRGTQAEPWAGNW